VKSRLTRNLGTILEPRAVSVADAITAVSELTYEQVFDRVPEARGIPVETIPIGFEQADFTYARANPRPNPIFDPDDGRFHLCYTGTILPLGFETLRAVFGAVALVRSNWPDHYSRLRVHFAGTSNQSAPRSEFRVMELARRLEIDQHVTEHPARIPYLDAVSVQTQASALLLMGSSEHHYTASKLFPALLAGRPILAAYHARSSVSAILRESQTTGVRLVEYDDVNRAEHRVTAIASAIIEMMETPSAAVSATPVGSEKYSASSLASRLASVFDLVKKKSLT
jgi:glycosyltransferase involved in cell wall biosynthesis